MHYYFDLIANLDETLWEFYEWENKDNLIPIKKVPLLRVKESVMKDFLSCEIKLEESFITPYIGKTILKNSKEKPILLLFSDTKNSILLEFLEDGSSIYRSKLLVEDELNCNEICYSLKEEKISYTKEKPLLKRYDFRKSQEEKRMIYLELKNIEKNKDKLKCSYYYYEWFHLLESDMSKMISKMKKELKKPFTLKMKEITKLIRLSYKGQL